jgi:hypothetical protein
MTAKKEEMAYEGKRARQKERKTDRMKKDDKEKN